MPTTLELVREARDLLDVLVETPDDQLDTTIGAWFDAWLVDVVGKVDALRHVSVRAEGESTFLRTEAERLVGRARLIDRVERHAKQRAELLLVEHERLTGEPKIKTPTVTAWLQESERVDGPEDPYRWPEDLRVVDVRPDKATALRRLRAGEAIPGLQLAKSRSLRWR